MSDQIPRINASPTKDFFISMLVKDIVLHQAILDLIDNCIDGAIRLRGREGNYDELEVRIRCNGEFFSIEDNCGGFSVDIARKYAFRFGRPPEAPKINHSVGRFGVGMKRALFKLGNQFSIESVCEESKFQLSVNVDQWETDPENWSFNFEYVDENPQVGEYGTKILIKELHQGIAEQFMLQNFINFLSGEVQKKNEEWMDRGLKIYLNSETALSSNPAKMFFSDEVKPAFQTIEHNGVHVKMFAGLAKTGQPKEAGWYIYCNNRLIVQADQSELTGWGVGGNPNFHNTFAMFRGYVYFDADDSFLLPWNTTKSGIDQDSELFRAVRLEMIKMMLPVIEYIKKLKKNNVDENSMELDGGEGTDIENDNEKLEKGIQETDIQKVTSIDVHKLTKVFQAPPIRIIHKPDTQKIQYNKAIIQINKVKKVLNVSTLKDVGERTFEYFYKAECED